MKTVFACLLTLSFSVPAFAACPPPQSEMLTVRLYFGQEMNGRAIAPAAWADFLARTVTPRFPSGFTVYDAQGQWRDTTTRRIAREASKVIEVNAPDTRALRASVEEVRRNYIARFHQQAVGLLTAPVCGTF